MKDMGLLMAMFARVNVVRGVPELRRKDSIEEAEEGDVGVVPEE